MMRILVGAALVALGGSVCAADGTTVSEKRYDLPKCTAPVAVVMVGEFQCKSAACQPHETGGSNLENLMRLAQAQQDGVSHQEFPGLGDGMSAMLTTALQQTGCFEIQDSATRAELKQQMEAAGLEFKPQPPDFVISGAITSVSMETKRKSFGGGMIPIVGAVSSSKASARLGVDVKIIDAHRGTIADAATFEGDNQTSSGGIGGAGYGGGIALVGGMSSVKGTPMEDVVRDVLVQVAAHSSGRIVALRAALTPSAPAAVADAPQQTPFPTTVAPASGETGTAH